MAENKINMETQSVHTVLKLAILLAYEYYFYISIDEHQTYLYVCRKSNVHERVIVVAFNHSLN